MAITDKEKGVWGLDQVYNKINQGSIWEYTTNISQLFAWGYNDKGYLAQNDTTWRSSPIQIPGTTWNQNDNNNGVSVAMTKTDGTLWSWGYNYKGTLGLNDLTDRSSPVQVGGDTDWARAYPGHGISFATKTDGTLYVWGDGRYGALGNNMGPGGNPNYSLPTGLRRSSPTQLPGTTWSIISPAQTNCSAIKTDGTMWAWGDNSGGILAQGNNTSYSSPVQIPGTTWSNCSTGFYQNTATKTDGTLWTWGANPSGALGLNNTTATVSPQQVPGTTWTLDQRAFASADRRTYAIKTDGTLWVWGNNNNGGLGLNQAIPVKYSSPVQIPGTTWKTVSASYDYTVLATKTDNTLWGWGINSSGHLGLNQPTNTRYSSPVQIPGSWNYANLTRRATFAQQVL